MSDRRWIWVSLPYATFALVVESGRIVMAPPIAAWTIGKIEGQVADYYRARGATFREIMVDNRTLPSGNIGQSTCVVAGAQLAKGRP